METTENKSIIRTIDSGVFEAKVFRGWGKYFVKGTDPEGRYTENQLLTSFVLSKNFPKIPAQIYTAIIKLYKYWVTKEKANSMEALVLLLRDETLTQWRAIVPKQYISGARVDGDNNDSVDLLTGEHYSVYPQQGWFAAGSSHSHNTMSAFWSGRDNDDELQKPGLHMVTGEVGSKNHTRASIVHHKRRYEIDVNKVAETTLLTNVTFHPNVLTMFRPLEESPQYLNTKKVNASGYKQPSTQSYLQGYDKTQTINAPYEDYSISYGGLYGGTEEDESALIYLDYLMADLAQADKNTKYKAAKLALEYLEPEVIEALGF